MTGLRDWRAQMSADDQMPFESVAGAVLRDLGYELSGRAIPAPYMVAAMDVRRMFNLEPIPASWSSQVLG